MMKRVVLFTLAGLLAMTTPALAQSAYDGVWKIDLSSAQLPDKPQVWSLEDGIYSCSSCVPAYAIPADGQFHKVEGYSYWDEMSLRIVDDRTIDDAQRLKGRQVNATRSQVSADGNTLKVTWTDMSTPNGMASTGEAAMSRVAPGAAGAHAISGSWKSEAVASISENSLIATMRLADGVFSFESGDGYSFEATLGGPAVPVIGDLAGATASVRQLADGSLEEIDYINGEPTSKIILTPAADGSILLRSESLKLGTTVSYKLIRN
ncbi:hypothetical protein D8I30_11240 [Brevundimonas naejangsanensis]|uniref:Lipocalin-like domain-containing protein n=2 Tax=Brevundimonas naejangsanensis TaxID=588932 RepID=A0A494RL97_9CAUL|nr:hypothetical protein D8I30_11240 [Brevundimonas naejangsanensis]